MPVPARVTSVMKLTLSASIDARTDAKFQVDGRVLRHGGDLIDAEPLAHDAHEARLGGRRLQQPARLLLAPVGARELTGARRRDERGVGRTGRHEERERARRLGGREVERRRRGRRRRGVAELRQIQEPRRLQHAAHDEPDTVEVRRARRARRVQRREVGPASAAASGRRYAAAPND